MNRIRVDFSRLAKNGMVRTHARRAEKPLTQGDRVVAFDPIEDMEFEAVVSELDELTGVVLLDVAWEFAAASVATSATRSIGGALVIVESPGPHYGNTSPATPVGDRVELLSAGWLMQAILLLADSAQTDANGKIHGLGIGWSLTTTPTPPAALIVFVKVPWLAANTKHSLEIKLVGEDGEPVIAPHVEEPMVIRGEFEVGRPPGLPHGMALDQAFTVPLPVGMTLNAGQIYSWRLAIDGTHEEAWTAAFFVRGQ